MLMAGLKLTRQIYAVRPAVITVDHNPEGVANNSSPDSCAHGCPIVKLGITVGQPFRDLDITSGFIVRCYAP
jgi:hypothetical protein